MTLAALGLAWLLGIAAAAFTGGDTWAAVAAAAALGAASFALRPRPSTLAFIAVGGALIFAASWRYDTTAPPAAPAGIARHNDGDAVRFRAIVSDEPQPAGATLRYRLSVRETYDDGRWRPDGGGVLMRTPPFPRYEYGDLLVLEGELETPPTFDDFDYREYLLRRGVGSLVAYPEVTVLDHDRGSALRAALIEVRSRLSSALADALPEPEVSLAAGVLLGKRARLPADLADDMNATGTSHLVAVSGQNVSLVAALVVAGLAWAIGRRPAALLALAALIGYAALVGGEPSVVRAAVMGGLYVVAIAAGRQSSAVVGLVLAGAVMTALDPQVAHDVSFQLSFAATLGLMTMAPALAARMRALAQRWPALDAFPLTRPAIALTAVTLAAIAFTLPITAVNFQRISLVAPLANLLAVPAFILVAATAGATAAAGALLPAAGEALGWLAWPPAAYMVAAVRLTADLPLASAELGGVGTGHAIVYYAALAAGVWLLARDRAESASARDRRPPTVRLLVPAWGLALILVLAAALVWLSLTTPAPGRLSVTFLDVGQGDAILIEGPAGHRVLVDGGPNGEAMTAALGRRLPFYDRRVDLLVLTHPQADHMGGLPAVLGRYDVASALAGPVEADSAVYRAWREALEAEAVPYHEASAGQAIDLGGGARLYVVAVPSAGAEPNEGSLVLKLVMGRASFLLTGDIESDGEAALLRSGVDLRAAVYKVPHHGSRTSSSDAFVAAVDPLVDVVSVGRDNRYGHPAPEVLERLDGDAVFRTDLHGDVTVSTDGHRLWVETARRYR